MVLDSGDEVYVWVGDRSTPKEKELSLKMAEVNQFTRDYACHLAGPFICV